MFVIYETATGRKQSETALESQIADPLPDGYTVVDVGDPAGKEWDAATKQMVPRVAPESLVISRADFMLRLGFERETILHAVRLNPDTPLQTRAQLEMLNGWLNRVTEVNVKHKATQLAVQLMAGILASLDALPEGVEAFAAMMLAPVTSE